MNGPTKEEALPAIESTRAGILIPIRWKGNVWLKGQMNKPYEAWNIKL